MCMPKRKGGSDVLCAVELVGDGHLCAAASAAMRQSGD